MLKNERGFAYIGRCGVDDMSATVHRDNTAITSPLRYGLRNVTIE